MKPRFEARYWADVDVSSAGNPRNLWRSHSDAVNAAWLVPRLSGRAIERVLKTDVFDEAQTAGLYPLLAAHARRVFGIDLSARTLAAARAHCAQLHGVQADVRSLPFADAAFDAVVSNSTLDHFASVGDIAAALAELHRVLRPAGRLLLTLDNLANPAVALRNALPFRLLHRLRIVPYSIGATCGPRRLRHLVQQVGFEVMEAGAVLHCPRVAAVAAMRLLERYASAQTQQGALRRLTAFERAASWRTRFITGYFVAVVAYKR
jgi:SAM-dependent methyltransferase